MDTELYFTFVAVCLVVFVTPGPSVAIAVIHGARYGPFRSGIVALGDISANMLQMIAAVAGLGIIISQSAVLFSLIKWAGAVYLFFIGLMMILKAGRAMKAIDFQAGSSPSLMFHYRQGFIVAASSPKAILFYGALFPQFIDTSSDVLGQFVLLALTCAVLDWITMCTYGLMAALVSSSVMSSPWIDRVGGGALIVTAGALAKTDP